MAEEALPIVRGYQYSLRMAVTGGDSPVFPEGAKLRAQVREYAGAPRLLAELTFDNGGLRRVSNDSVDMVMSEAATRAIGNSSAVVEFSRTDVTPFAYLYIMLRIPVMKDQISAPVVVTVKPALAVTLSTPPAFYGGLAGVLQGAGSAFASLSSLAGVLLSGSALGSGSGTAALRSIVNAVMAGNAAGAGSAIGVLSAQAIAGLSGLAAGVGSGVGALTAQAISGLSGAAAGAGSGVAVLRSIMNAALAGAAAGSGAGAGVLSAASASSATYMRDVSGSQPVIYSLYKLRAGHTGPVATIQRLSDSATLDVATGSDGQSPDMSSVAAFLSGTVGRVLRKDQGGGGLDETQATFVLRPRYISANDQFGKVGVTFDGLNAQTIVPAGLSTNRTAVTMAFVGGVSGAAGMMQAGVNSGTTTNIQMIVDSIRPNLLADSFRNVVRAPPTDIGIVIGTSTSLRVNETKGTLGSPSSAAITGGYIGKGNFGSAAGMWGNHMADIFYPTLLGATDEANLYADLKAIFGIPAFTDQVLFVGDSLQWGQASSGGQSVSRLVSPNLSRRCFVANAGISGQTQGTITAAGGAYDVVFVSTYLKNIIVNNAGTNDIAGTTTGANLYASMLSWINARKAKGYLVIIETLIARGTLTAAQETERLDYNQRLRDNAASVGFTLVDSAALAAMQNPSNQTFFDPDTIHLKDPGYAAREPGVRAAINALLGA